MNATEQRTHRTVTLALDERLGNVETVVTGLANYVEKVRDDGRAALGIEKTDRLALALEQRGYVDTEDRQLRESIQRLQVRTVLLSQSTFWQRLLWLFRGELP